MKNPMKSFRKQNHFIGNLIVLFLATVLTSGIQAQNKGTVSGKVIEEQSNLPIPYAYVFLNGVTDPESNFRTVCNDSGVFMLGPVAKGKYRLFIKAVGYRSVSKNIEVSSSQTLFAGVIPIQDSTLMLSEATVVAERMKGKTEGEKTIFNISQKMLRASGTGTDLLRLIPGVQVDLKQNISLEGSRDILILVDGIERDKSYVSQLDPALIDNVEVYNAPPSNYDGHVTGVINLILKKERNSGISGRVFSEIPTSSSEIYIFPTYSLNYGLKKLNLFTSYNGEINYENLDETSRRKAWRAADTTEIYSVQSVRQKNLSHKFQYGVDYYLSSRDMVNFYGFYNPYSYEQNGRAVIETKGGNGDAWDSHRKETDKNTGIYNSIFFRHKFRKPGMEITMDISRIDLRVRNTTVYLNEDAESGPLSLINSEDARQKSTTLKTDYLAPIRKGLTLAVGAKAKLQTMEDNGTGDFKYTEDVYALYGSLQSANNHYDFNLGLRAEGSESSLKNGFSRSELSLLPYASFRYKFNSKYSMQMSYRRSVNRPGIYQMNPYLYRDDPFTVRKGNPLLEPEFRNSLYLEQSLQFHGSYCALRLFYDHFTRVINTLIVLNDTGAFEMQPQNLGAIRQYGMQLTGALKFGFLTLNPGLRFYNLSTTANSQAKESGVENRSRFVMESTLSAVVSFKKDFALSGILQYATRKNNIQGNAYSDAIYFLTLDKTFKKNLKVGIESALPFARSVIYRGSETRAENFSSNDKGILKLSTVPVMFRVSYQFQSGKNRETINRDKEEIDRKPKQGF
jgi:outer membrane receptor protein involved in Fe transport